MNLERIVIPDPLDRGIIHFITGKPEGLRIVQDALLNVKAMHSAMAYVNDDLLVTKQAFLASQRREEAALREVDRLREGIEALIKGPGGAKIWMDLARLVQQGPVTHREVAS